jgi:DNA-directed RNA polymerase subunit M/transcription elongation factor TFIIS
MDQLIDPARRCPKCSSREYLFRGRKKIAGERGQEAAVETKYRCKSCGHEWRVRVPVKEAG